MNLNHTRGRVRSAFITIGAALAVSTLVSLSSLGSVTSAQADDIVDPTVEITAPAEAIEAVEPVEDVEPAPVALAAPADPAAAAATPVAVDDLMSVGTGGISDISPTDLFVNDSDQAPTGVEIDDPAGLVTMSGGWIHAQTPLGFTGLTFNYRFTNAIGTSNWAVVTLVGAPGSQVPFAYPDNYSTPNDVTLTIAAPGLLANDDGSGGTLTLTGLSGAAGQVVIHSNGSFDYTPTAGFTGTKTFYYQAMSNGLPTNWAKVTIAVTAGTGIPAAPVAVADSYQTGNNVVLDMAAKGVLLNDSSPTATVFDTNDSTGEITLAANGALTYVPAFGFAGTKTFEYRIIDAGSVSNWATVTITVAAPVAPVAVNDKYSMEMNTTLKMAAPGVLANDSAGITWWDGGFYSGTMVLYSDGSFVYTPDVGFSGTTVIEYTIRDNFITSNVATITIEVVDTQLPTLELDDPILPGDTGTGTLAFTGINSTWIALPAISIVLLGSLALGYSAARRRRAGTV